MTEITKLKEHSLRDLECFLTALDEYILQRCIYLGVVSQRGSSEEIRRKMEVAKRNLGAYLQPLLCFDKDEDNAQT